MQTFDGQLITVLGGGGFLGRYVVQRLLARGARVRIAQRTPRAATFLKPLGGLGQTQFVHADVRDAASVARAVQGSDAVINLVGAFDDMRAVQADGAGHVATTAKAAGARAPPPGPDRPAQRRHTHDSRALANPAITSPHELATAVTAT